MRRATIPVTVVSLACLALLLVPAASAGKLVHAPADVAGVGRTDVRDEPNEPADANGFAACGTVPDGDGTSCGDPAGTLVLDALYESSTVESAVDANNAVNVALHGGSVDERQHYILPGSGYFFAWWGWWADSGGHGWAQEAGTGLGDAHDGRIDDAHDDDGTWDDPRHGVWDEFVWRGDNPWAPSHPLLPHPSEPHDRMLLFIEPGTHQPREDPPTSLDTGADGARIADAEFKDDTDLPAYAQQPADQMQGWAGAHGYDFTFLDQSLVLTTRVTTAVNPDSLDEGRRYDVDSATAADVDVYSAVDPQVEHLYRSAIWDPGDEQEGVSDEVGFEEGVKEPLRVSDPAGDAAGTAQEVARGFTDPVAPHQGMADDIVQPPRRHEPNQPGDAYVNATYDAGTSYGRLDGGSYYEPGPDQTYHGYDDGDRLWLDAHAGYGTPLYLVVFPFPFNLNVHPAPNLGDPADPGQGRTAVPGFLYVTAQAGLWWDANDDDWIGRLDDPGRATSPGEPYRGGTVDDPNDYGDTPLAAENDPDRQGVGEWRPLCEGSASVEGTLRPGTSDGSWGPTGVYVIHDPNGGYNPYDDGAADVTGDTPLWQDGDDERLSRHVLEGPIDFRMQWCSADRGWYADRFVYTPAGTATYDVTVNTTATLETDQTARPDDVVLPAGASVTDVDVVHDWGASP